MRFSGNRPFEHALEHFDVVDALADERALAETVLVDVRDGSRVRVDPRLSAENAREERSIGPGEARHDARLQDPVSRRDAPLPGVVARTVQRMRHRADQLPSRIARQLGVGVERDHVLDAGERRDIADDRREALRRALFAGEKRVQVAELPALALVTHPQPLPRIPQARAMEQEEDVARIGGAARRGISR